MHATIRRYESVDATRIGAVIEKANETLLLSLSAMPGFHSYSLIDAGNGVMTSVSVFDTEMQADHSSRAASSWLRDERLMTALPTPPRVTSGEVIVHMVRELARA